MPTVAAHPTLRSDSRYSHPADPYQTPRDFTKPICLNLLAHFPVEDVVRLLRLAITKAGRGRFEFRLRCELSLGGSESP